MDLKQLHQLKCELLKVYRYQGLTLQELLCEFYSHINEVINSTNGLIDIVDYLVGEGLSNEVATHLNQMLIDGTFDKIISNKVDELSTNLNNQFNEMKKIIESNISESDKLIENLRVYDSRFNNIDTKNIEQDSRLKDVEYRNKVQDVYLSGLFNENKDGRLSVEGEGNSLKLEGSKAGLVEVDKVVGNTLVNLVKREELMALSKYNLLNNGYVTYKVDGSNYMDYVHENISMFKPSTTYTLVLDILKNTFDKPISFNITGGSIVKSYSVNNLEVGSLGVFKIKFDTKDDFSNCTWVAFVNGGSTQTGVGNITLRSMILEGDYTNKPIPQEYFEGLQSSFESNLVTQEMINEGLESEENLGKYKVPVKVRGKNLFDTSNKIIGYYFDGTGGLSPYAECIASETYIKVTPGISLYSNINKGSIQYLEYDSNKNFIQRSNMAPNRTYIVPAGVYYLRFSAFTVGEDFKLQIEEGTLKTDYEEYFERTTNVYLNSPLLEGDEIVMKDGELCHYHEYKEKIFDGSNDEGWGLVGDISDRVNKRFGVALQDFINLGEDGITNKTLDYLMCDRYFTMDFGSMYSNDIVGISAKTKINIRDSAKTLEEFVAKLQANPLKIIYKLAEPYYEPIQADKLILECANDSTIHIESIVPVESVKASYTGNIPNAYQMDEDIEVTQTAVDFLLMSNVGEVMVMSFMNNTKSGNNLGSYFANRIIKKALSYDDVINKYPQFKDDIDVILINEGYEYLIK